MKALNLVRLTPLMELTSGRPEIVIGLIDGPIAMSHADLVGANIREVPGKFRGTCARASSVACMHGTFVAGTLCAKRNSGAPAICPGCTLLVRPIFAETSAGNERTHMPSATPEELAVAIIECIEAGAGVVNLSVALSQPSSKGQRDLEEALHFAARRRVIVVAAAGNQGALGSSPITRHRWTIPVVACDLDGRPMCQSNLGNSIGRQGLCAPGDEITSIGSTGRPLTLGGTSVAAPFVTATIALLWSVFPAASAVQIKFAVTRASVWRRTTIVPPLLDAMAAYRTMETFVHCEEMKDRTALSRAGSSINPFQISSIIHSVGDSHEYARIHRESISPSI